MTANRVKSDLVVVARLLAGALFLYSGFAKLLQPAEYFQIAISFYDLFPDRLIVLISYVMPWLELVLGGFLFLGYWVEGSAGLLALMTLGFQLVLGQAFVRDLPIDDCGCFGGGFVHLTLFQSFAMDTVLLLLLIFIATYDDFPLSLDRWLLKTSIPTEDPSSKS